MDHQLIQDGFGVLTGFAERHGLGRPSKVLKSESFGQLVGVGAEWPDGRKTAVSIDSHPDEAQEILRLAQAWKNGT